MAEEDREQTTAEEIERSDGASTPGGWDGVERRQPEKSFLDQPGLFVSSRKIVVEGSTHPVTRTSSARVHRSTQNFSTETPASSLGKGVIVLGLVVAAILAFVGTDQTTGVWVRILKMLPGLVVIVIGYFMTRQQYTRTVIRYNAVLYDHAHADVTLASSTDQAYITKIVDAIKEAESTIRDWQQAQHQISLSAEALEKANRAARERSERLMRHSQEEEAARSGEDDE